MKKCFFLVRLLRLISFFFYNQRNTNVDIGDIRIVALMETHTVNFSDFLVISWTLSAIHLTKVGTMPWTPRATSVEKRHENFLPRKVVKHRGTGLFSSFIRIQSFKRRFHGVVVHSRGFIFSVPHDCSSSSSFRAS